MKSVILLIPLVATETYRILLYGRQSNEKKDNIVIMLIDMMCLP